MSPPGPDWGLIVFCLLEIDVTEFPEKIKSCSIHLLCSQNTVKIIAGIHSIHSGFFLQSSFPIKIRRIRSAASMISKVHFSTGEENKRKRASLFERVLIHCWFSTTWG